MFHGEWMRTGDTYVRGADGSWTCLGRADDVLKVGGIWVSPTEVETRILEHPARGRGRRRRGAGRGRAGQAGGLRRRHARTRAIDEADIIAFCRAGLASFKRPRKVVTVTELPKTATGKIQRYRLRAHGERIFYNFLTFGIVA